MISPTPQYINIIVYGASEALIIYKTNINGISGNMQHMQRGKQR